MPMTYIGIRFEYISSLTRSKREFDIVPHLDGPDHDAVLEADDAFALCSCLSDEALWRPTYRSALKSKGFISIDDLTFLPLFSPSCLTLWHQRKQMVLNNKLSLSDELGFTRLVLSKFPRSTETLQHRLWVLDRLSSDEFKSLFDDEVAFCELLGDKHRCNYMIWQHRRWLIEKLGISSVLLLSQLKGMDEWNAHHPLDISGWSYRAFLLQLCKKFLSKEDFERILIREITKSRVEVEESPEIDALWWFKEQVVQLFLESCKNLQRLKELDPSIQIRPDLKNLTDKKLEKVNDIEIPLQFNKSWSSLLYKRYLRWLSQTIDSYVSYS
nr:protein prenyltransferase alpha subunit [Hymenolepis microstoma]